MVWPLPAPLALAVVAVTVGASSLCAARARKMRSLAAGAVMSGNPDAIAATERRVRRSWRRFLTYGLPTVLIGMALLTTQSIAYLAVALPR